eukprot:jgi/Chrzof1/9207/Cz03g39250.t1
MAGVKTRRTSVTVNGKSVDVAVDELNASGAATASLGVILTHGASGDLDSGYLPEYAQGIARAGYPCLRFTCKPIQLPTRVAVMKAILAKSDSLLHGPPVKQWVLAGHSMGARVASAVAADDDQAHAQRTIMGCVFSSYPLHPPGNPAQLRDDPLCKLQQPLLFLRGSKDAFSTPQPWEDVMARMTSTNIQVHTVSGGDHGLKVKGGKAAQEAVKTGLTTALTQFLQAVAHSGGGTTAGKSKTVPTSADANEINSADKVPASVAGAEGNAAAASKTDGELQAGRKSRTQKRGISTTDAAVAGNDVKSSKTGKAGTRAATTKRKKTG